MSVIIEVSPNTYEETGFKNISHACGYAVGVRANCIHNKRKHNCSSFLMKFWRNSDNGTVSQCFSCKCLLFSCKRLQRYRKKSIWQKNNSFPFCIAPKCVRVKCTFLLAISRKQSRWDSATIIIELHRYFHYKLAT